MLDFLRKIQETRFYMKKKSYIEQNLLQIDDVFLIQFQKTNEEREDNNQEVNLLRVV